MPPTQARDAALTLRRVERSAGDLSSRGDPPDGGRPRLVPRRSRPRTGPGWDWSPRPASRPSSRGCATAASSTPVTADVFGTAPRELTRSVTPASRPSTWSGRWSTSSRSTLRSWPSPVASRPCASRCCATRREIAFAAAEVYAHAAEARGAWDARLEGLVVDAVLRGEADDSMQSRAAALGWGVHHAGRRGRRKHSTRRLRRRGGRAAPLGRPTGRGRPRCRPGPPARVHPGQGRRSPGGGARRCRTHFGDGADRGRPDRPPPVRCGALGPGGAVRAVAARTPGPRPPARSPPTSCSPSGCWSATTAARVLLVERVYNRSRRAAAATCCETRGGLPRERQRPGGTARILFVHPNTVRYRLGKIADLTGYDLGDPHDAHTVRIALALGRLGHAAPPRRPVRAPQDERFVGILQHRRRDVGACRSRQGHEEKGGLIRARHRLPWTGLPDPRLPRALARAARSSASASSRSRTLPASTSSPTARRRTPRPSGTPPSPSP